MKIEKKNKERIFLQVQRGTYYIEQKKEKLLREVTLLKNLQINRFQCIINISAEHISIIEFSSELMGKYMLHLLQTPVARKCHKNLMKDQDNTQNILRKLEIVLNFLIFQS